MFAVSVGVAAAAAADVDAAGVDVAAAIVPMKTKKNLFQIQSNESCDQNKCENEYDTFACCKFDCEVCCDCDCCWI